MSFTLTLPEDNALVLNAMSRALAEIAQGCTVAVGVVEPVQYTPTDSTVTVAGDDTPSDLDIEPVEADIEPVEVDESVELDKDGFPWDNRINSTPASVTASGVWKMRRKPKDMDDDQWSDYIDMVRNELTNLMSIEVGSDGLVANSDDVERVVSDNIEVIQPPVMTVKVEELKPVTAGDVFGETALIPPATSVAPSVTPTITTFPQLMTWLTGMTGKITVEQVNGALAEWNMNSVALLAKRPDLIPVFVAKIEALL